MDLVNLGRRILAWAERRAPHGKKAFTYGLKESLKRIKEGLVG